MNKKDYETVVNLIIDEDFDKANALISKIMEQKTKSIYKQRLIEDGDLKSPDAMKKPLSVEKEILNRLSDWFKNYVNNKQSATEFLNDYNDNPKAYREKILSDILSSDNDLNDNYNNLIKNDTDNLEDFNIEFDNYFEGFVKKSNNILSDKRGTNIKEDFEDETTAEENPESSPEEIKYQFLDIQKDFDRLKAEFEKVLGTDMDSEEVVDTDTVETDIEEDCYDSDIPNENDEASPLTFANESEEDDGENLDSDENIFNDDDLNDIAESLELSTVSIDMKTPKEAGTNKSVKTDNKSFVDTKEGEKGEPIQIKSSGELKGTGRQPSPPVKNPSYKSTNVMDLKKVEKEGDKSAKLNSKEGFGKDEDDSPLSKIKR